MDTGRPREIIARNYWNPVCARARARFVYVAQRNASCTGFYVSEEEEEKRRDAAGSRRYEGESE